MVVLKTLSSNRWGVLAAGNETEHNVLRQTSCRNLEIFISGRIYNGGERNYELSYFDSAGDALTEFEAAANSELCRLSSRLSVFLIRN